MAEVVGRFVRFLRRCSQMRSGVSADLRSVIMALGALGLLGPGMEAQTAAWTARYNSGFQDAEACPGGCVSFGGRHSVAVDASGNTYVTGYALDATGRDFRTIKYAADGTVVWSVRYKAPDSGESVAHAVAVDPSGNAYVTGYSVKANGPVCQTIKYAAADGAVLWSVRDESGDNSNGVAIAVDAAGNAYVAGISIDGAATDYRTVKYAAASGDVLWSKSYDGDAHGDDFAYDIALDNSGNAYVTGVSSNANNRDYRTIKYATADGAIVWSVGYDGGPDSNDEAYAIALDGTGNAYVTGGSAAGAAVAYRTIKYAAADGSVLWSTSNIGPVATSGQAFAIAVDPVGNAYVTGHALNGTRTDYRTVKYAGAAGALLWSVGSSGSTDRQDLAWAIALDGTGNAYVTGYSTNGIEIDYKTIKYATTDGAVLWSKDFDGAAHGDDVPYAIAVDAGGNAHVTGSSWNGTNKQYRTLKYAAADGTALFSVTDGSRVGALDQPGSGAPTVGQRSLAVDRVGNAYVTGWSILGNVASYQTAKFAATDGAMLWSKAYAGESSSAGAYAIALDFDGNAYVTGRALTANEYYDYRTIKYAAADGAVLWSVGYSGPGGSYDASVAIAVDSMGNAYVTGYSTDGNGNTSEARTIKYAAADGHVLWSVGFSDTTHPFSGAQAIALDASGNAYVTGYSSNGSGSDNDYLTIKYAATNGAVLWTADYDGGANDFANAIAVDRIGNAYVTGPSSNGSNTDYRTIKYAAANGAVLWNVVYNGAAKADDVANAIDLDEAGNAYVTGTSSNGSDTDYRTVKYTAANGAVLWSVGYSGPAASDDRAHAIAVDLQGHAYVTGYSRNGSDDDYRTVKYAAADGALLWSAGYANPVKGRDQAYAVALSAGAVYVSGSSLDIDTGNDFFTVKYATESTIPTNPSSLASVTHTPATWSNVGVIGMQWSGAADEPGGSGLAGYSILFDTVAATLPDTTVDVIQTTDPHNTASAALPDGVGHYFHLRTCDHALNCASALSVGPFWIDRTTPTTPLSLSSTSHAISIASFDSTIDIQWGPASDPLTNGVASGIDGYSFFFDSNAVSSCEQTKNAEQGTTAASGPSLANGTWYAHVCARDNAGNWSGVASAGPYLIADPSVRGEITHGIRLIADLAALPGPSLHVDRYRCKQKPYSSYEVVVDEASGDVGLGAGPLVVRLGSDGTTIAQSSQPVGAGPARSLRWENSTSSAVENEVVRIQSASCGTDCDPGDLYRLRAYETTYTIPRFNNSGSQITVLLIQNPGNTNISGHVYFWSGAGALLATSSFSLGPHQLHTLNTAAVAGLAGQVGTISLSHDGRYGELVGKAVSLEPSTGFSFDSLLERKVH
jgi:outer membrane protein assembly factor BamB